MNLLAFDLRASLGHFRRPDTLVTHATYPFIPRTALHGLCAAVLGLDRWPDPPPEEADARDRPWCGLRILNPVRTVSHQLSYLGKGWTGDQAGGNFNRPTTVELVVQPHYRVYYTGPLVDELAGALRKQHGVWHTYLGAAFCLTFPRYVREYTPDRWEWKACTPGEEIECRCVVPTSAVAGIVLRNGTAAYARAGGFVRRNRGGRKFEGVVSFLFDPNGGPVAFRCAPLPETVRFARIGLPDEPEVIALW